MAITYQAFARSKNTATRRSFLINTSLVKFSIRIIWSILHLLALKPFCRFARILFNSKNNVSL